MPLLIYSVWRIALFLVAGVGLYLLGARGFLLVVIAAFGAWGVSYVALRRSRDKAADYLAERARSRSRRRFPKAVEHDAEIEDAAIDADPAQRKVS